MNKLPVPCLLSLVFPPGFFVKGFFSKSSLGRTGKLGRGSDQSYGTSALPSQAGKHSLGWRPGPTLEDSALTQPRLSLQQLQSYKAVPLPCRALPQARQVFTTAGTFCISKILHGKTPWGMEVLCLLSAPSCHIILPQLFLLTSG